MTITSSVLEMANLLNLTIITYCLIRGGLKVTSSSGKQFESVFSYMSYGVHGVLSICRYQNSSDIYFYLNDKAAKCVVKLQIVNLVVQKY